MRERTGESTDGLYGEAYYESHCGRPYRRGDPVWEAFFARIADAIVAEIGPTTVLDAGCAMGFLVEALRVRGVDARGLDVSEYAIEQVPAEIRPFVHVGSVTDEIEGQVDLVACIEVLEHVSPDDADAAIANFARHADAVLFSSSPDDEVEVTHVNVRPISDWVVRFARAGLYPDVTVDPRFLTRHALLFRRRDVAEFAVVAEATVRGLRHDVDRERKRLARAEASLGLRLTRRLGALRDRL